MCGASLLSVAVIYLPRLSFVCWFAFVSWSTFLFHAFLCFPALSARWIFLLPGLVSVCVFFPAVSSLSAVSISVGCFFYACTISLYFASCFSAVPVFPLSCPPLYRKCQTLRLSPPVLRSGVLWSALFLLFFSLWTLLLLRKAKITDTIKLSSAITVLSCRSCLSVSSVIEYESSFAHSTG